MNDFKKFNPSNREYLNKVSNLQCFDYLEDYYNIRLLDSRKALNYCQKAMNEALCLDSTAILTENQDLLEELISIYKSKIEKCRGLKTTSV